MRKRVKWWWRLVNMVHKTVENIGNMLLLLFWSGEVYYYEGRGPWVRSLTLAARRTNHGTPLTKWQTFCFSNSESSQCQLSGGSICPCRQGTFESTVTTLPNSSLHLLTHIKRLYLSPYSFWPFPDHHRIKPNLSWFQALIFPPIWNLLFMNSINGLSMTRPIFSYP